MIKKLSQNLPYKFLSIVVAFFVWVLASNVVNPIESGFVNVRVDVINEEAVYKLNKAYKVVDPRTCKINYKINAEQANLVRQSDFKAYIDLSELTIDNEELTIHYDPLNEVDRYISNVTIEPKNLRVVFDDMKRTALQVKYTSKGRLSDGYTIGNVIFSPNVVYVSGNEDVIENVSHISIDIPVKDGEDSFSGTSNVRVISKSGKEMSLEGIELSANEINYTATVYSKTNVTLNAIISGNAKGGQYEGAQVTPTSIILEGPKGVVEDIYILDLPAIDISKMTESNEIVYDINDVLPPGFKCSSTNEIKVNIIINNKILGPKN